MKWVLLILGFGICILFVVNMKRILKEEQDNFENPKHLDKKNDSTIC